MMMEYASAINSLISVSYRSYILTYSIYTIDDMSKFITDFRLLSELYSHLYTFKKAINNIKAIEFPSPIGVIFSLILNRTMCFAIYYIKISVSYRSYILTYVN